MIVVYCRYCSVCHPYTYRDIINTASVNKRVIVYVIPVIIFSFVLNIPKFFETKIVYTSETNEEDVLRGNMFGNNTNDSIASLIKILQSGQQQQRVTYRLSSLRNNPDYIRYCLILL